MVKILESGIKIYGPYMGGSGRKFLIKIFPNGERKSIYYTKYLMEEYLGRPLKTNEEVNHIDRDHTNDSIDNLQIVDKSVHAKLDAIYVKDILILCAYCQKEIYKNARTIDHNAKLGKTGPFCSRSCAGKYSKEIQMGMRNPLPTAKRIKREDRKYYQLEK